MRFSLPEASANAAQTDWLIGGLTAVSFAVLALVFGLLLFYVVRYRHNSPLVRGELAEKTFRFEIGWTAATLLVFLDQYAENLRRRQTEDVEDVISGRPTRDQHTARSGQ
jgi:heme/copper-type cytochrome/quinol oxidase subunit 2